jgi:phosphatidate cytidylyltransferase
MECGTADHSPVKAVAASPRFDLRRVYTALILIPLLYAVIGLLPAPAFSLLVLFAGGLALVEFYRLCFEEGGDGWLMGIGLVGFAVLILGRHQPEIVFPGLLAAVVGILSVPLIRSASLDHHVRNSAVTMFGVVYVGLTLSTLVGLRLLPHGERFVIFVLLVTWIADTGAYYAGTWFGRHPLAPRISPKKTIEGLCGGLLAAILISYVARWWFLPSLSGLDCLVLASLLTAAGLWGDLAESAIKRGVGIKDSGGILPGHGGMLDRLDSLLFAAPAFYYYMMWVDRLSV